MRPLEALRVRPRPGQATARGIDGGNGSPIGQGTIKVVWANREADRIYSRMFASLGPARDFGESKRRYLIFRLLWQRNLNTFAWELLPYGNYATYQKAVRIYSRLQLL